MSTAVARLLIVEDESVSANSLRHRLQKMGYEIVAICATGADAIAKTAKLNPDLVLMDIRLRGDMDGIRTAEQIRLRFDIPVIFLTAHAEDDTINRATLAAPYGYLLKPFDPHELNISVRMALYKHEMEKRLVKSEERYRLLFEGMLDGFALHEIMCNDQGQPVDYRFLEVNPAFERLTGLKAAKIVGKSAREVMPNIEPFWIERYGKVALTGESAHFEEFSADLQRYYEVAAYSPAQGQFAVVLTDVTKRRLAEEALQMFTNELEVRVKQLNCLYQSSQILDELDLNAPEKTFYKLITQAQQGFPSPERVCVRLLLGNKSYTTENFSETPRMISSPIRVQEKKTSPQTPEGTLQVFYLKKGTANKRDEQLQEERTLLEELAARISQSLERKQAEEALLKQNIALSNLNQFSIELSMLPSEENIEAFITRKIKEFSGAELSIFSEYNPINKINTVKHVEMEPGLLEKVVGLVGKQLEKIQAPISDEMYNEMISERVGLRKTLYEVSFGVISHSASAAIQAILNIDSFIGLAYVLDGKLYGSTLLGMGKGQTDPPKKILENFTNLAALSIRRKRAEEALRDSEGRLRSVVDSAAEAILTADTKGLILTWNPAAEIMFGYGQNEVQGKPISMLMPVRYRDDHHKGLGKFHRSGVSSHEGGTIELVGLHKSGKEFPIELSLSSWKADRRNFLTGLIRDITERKQRTLEQEAIARISVALRQASTRHSISPIIIGVLQELLHVKAAALATYDEEGGELTMEASFGIDFPRPGVPFPYPGGVLEKALLSKQPIFVDDLLAEYPASFVRTADPKSAVVVPLMVHETAIGLLFLGKDELFTESERLVTIAVAEIAANALHLAIVHEQTEQRLLYLKALRSIDQAITGSFDLQVTLDVLVQQAVVHLHVDAADVLILNPFMGWLEYSIGKGLGREAHRRLRISDSIAGTAVLERRMVHVSICQEDKIPEGDLSYLQGHQFEEYYCVPLISKGNVKGVLEVFHHHAVKPGADWLDFLEALGRQAAIAVDNAELFQKLQSSNVELSLAYNATLEGWTRTLDLRDKETEGHTQRVVELTLRLGKSFGLPDTEMVNMHRGALLHDIGKMVIPDSILLKPGPLTEDEWTIMRRHPQVAYDLLSPISYLQASLDIPYYHHEKWDGSGYPRGLRGTEIPLAARIFSVVDVWDALCSDRPYRKAWSFEQALDYLREQSGIHFDPQVVDIFTRVLLQK